MKNSSKTRFDTRLPIEQKHLFEYAATLGGFRTLTEFILFAAQEQAKQIVEKHNTILASQKDNAIFFDALISPPKPNTRLRKAVSRYKKEFQLK